VEVRQLTGHINDVPLTSVLARIRRRQRLQAALDGAAEAAVLASALALVDVYLSRLRLISPRAFVALFAVAIAAVLVNAVRLAIRRIPLDAAARAADRAHQLHDRLRSALCFSREPQPTDFMRAAMADGERAATRVSAKIAAPFSRPRALGPAAIVAGVAGIVALLHFPTRAAIVSAPPRAPRLVVDRDALEAERAATDELRAQALQAGDKDLQQLADELNQLLASIDEEQLTRKEAFDKLAELEKKYLGIPDGQLEELKQKLKKAGAELTKSKLLEKTGEALKQEDLEKAKKELEKLAADAEKASADPKVDKKFDEEQRQEAAKALEQAAKDEEQKKQEQAEKQREEQLRDEERKLKKELAQKPNDEELQRKLQRNQRELQKLEREKQERAERQRELQRLQRELEKAAEQLRQKMSPQALKQLAEEMRKMQDEIRKLGSSSQSRGRGQMQIAEIKEVLRRMGRSDGKDGKSNGKGGAQAQSGDGNDKGKGKRGKGKGDLMQEFDERAGGDKPKAMLLGAHGGDQNMLLPLPLGPGQGAPKPEGNGDQLPGGDRGDGIGDQHDPNLQGDATRLGGKKHETRVSGKEAAGPSRSQTILGSADKGFASTGYKKVYGDYTAVVEEVMSKERVPPGYRFYVKRYFQLIKPRE
jgi:chemotaxis protein histidine kinase CheA